MKLGIYANVSGKTQLHKYVEYGGIACKTPRALGGQSLIIRAMWKSYDDVSSEAGPYYPDIIVGGIVDFRLYQFPELSRQAMKWTIRSILSVNERLK